MRHSTRIRSSETVLRHTNCLLWTAKIYISVYCWSSPGSVQPRRYVRTNEKLSYSKSPTSKTNDLKSERERFGLRLFTLLDSDSSDLTITSPAYYTNDTYDNFLDESWLVKADEGKVSGRSQMLNVAEANVSISHEVLLIRSALNFQSIRNLIGASTAVLPRPLPNFKAIWKCQHPVPRVSRLSLILFIRRLMRYRTRIYIFLCCIWVPMRCLKCWLMRNMRSIWIKAFRHRHNIQATLQVFPVHCHETIVLIQIVLFVPKCFNVNIGTDNGLSPHGQAITFNRSSSESVFTDRTSVDQQESPWYLSHG